MSAQQSYIPYPWKERKKSADARRLISPVVRVTGVLAGIMTVFVPVTVLVWLWYRFGFRSHNDSWSVRGTVVLLAGIIGALIVGNPLNIALAWHAVLLAFGDRATATPVVAIATAVAFTLPLALIVHGLHALASSFQVEKTTDAFLKDQRPNWFMKLRRRRNTRRLHRGSGRWIGARGLIPFGVVVGDRVPWRQSRYGMTVAVPIERAGHGAFVGRSGTGKTSTALTFTHHALQYGCGVIYMTFKATHKGRSEFTAVAEDDNAPCQAIDVGFGSQDTTWIDLFNWDGTYSDKASTLIECLQFPEGEGGSQHYRNLAEAWVPMQLHAADLVGLQPGEGMFDFLLATSHPAMFAQRIEPLRNHPDPAVKDLFAAWRAHAGGTRPDSLSGLNNELRKLVNAAGDRLKPNPTNPDPVSLRDCMTNGGLVYIGIVGGINDVVVKVLGSFIIKQIDILIAERYRNPALAELPNTFVIPDEASQMGKRTEVFKSLYTMAREAKVWLWPSYQSLAEWPETVRGEMRANTSTYVASHIPDQDTAESLASTIPTTYALSLTSDESVQQQAFQNQRVGIDGDSRITVVTDPLLRPHRELADTPDYHAHIWAVSGAELTRGRWWERRRVRRDENTGDAPKVHLVPYTIDDSPMVTATPQPQTATVATPIPLGATAPDSATAPDPTAAPEPSTGAPEQAQLPESGPAAAPPAPPSWMASRPGPEIPNPVSGPAQDSHAGPVLPPTTQTNPSDASSIPTPVRPERAPSPTGQHNPVPPPTTTPNPADPEHEPDPIPEPEPDDDPVDPTNRWLI